MKANGKIRLLAAQCYDTSVLSEQEPSLCNVKSIPKLENVTVEITMGSNMAAFTASGPVDYMQDVIKSYIVVMIQGTRDRDIRYRRARGHVNVGQRCLEKS